MAVAFGQSLETDSCTLEKVLHHSCQSVRSGLECMVSRHATWPSGSFKHTKLESTFTAHLSCFLIANIPFGDYHLKVWFTAGSAFQLQISEELLGKRLLGCLLTLLVYSFHSLCSRFL